MYVAGLVIPVPEDKMEAYRPGEKIVFAWQIWADKASLDAAETRMHADGALDAVGDIPFDAQRLILGCFSPICTVGRA